MRERSASGAMPMPWKANTAKRDLHTAITGEDVYKRQQLNQFVLDGIIPADFAVDVDSTKSVSYTHLDVYKRQGNMKNAAGRLWKRCRRKSARRES